MSWILALTIPCRDDGAFLITNAHVLLELFTSVDEFQKRGYENQKERLLSSLQKRLFLKKIIFGFIKEINVIVKTKSFFWF